MHSHPIPSEEKQAPGEYPGRQPVSQAAVRQCRLMLRVISTNISARQSNRRFGHPSGPDNAAGQSRWMNCLESERDRVSVRARSPFPPESELLLLDRDDIGDALLAVHVEGHAHPRVKFKIGKLGGLPFETEYRLVGNFVWPEICLPFADKC